MTVAAQFQQVTQRFGDFTAVDAIDLTIPAGQFTTLLGPSGCGKTTSLRMLAGYTVPTSGTILIDGVDATRTPPERRGLGMVFQSYALFPHMTVAENVGYGLKLRKVGAAERRRVVEETLDLVGLGHLAGSRPKKLSGGQQQRVALARAIAIRPKLLLLDEPLSNLDARLRIHMRAELRRIQAETGLTVVLVTHDQDEALELSDQMVVMREGRILQAGAPQDVFPSPRTGTWPSSSGTRTSWSPPTAPSAPCVPSTCGCCPGSASTTASPARATASPSRGSSSTSPSGVSTASSRSTPTTRPAPPCGSRPTCATARSPRARGTASSCARTPRTSSRSPADGSPSVRPAPSTSAPCTPVPHLSPHPLRKAPP
nr:ATP-binding cassette domain-containing protein [Litorihabitans aurantiacus]